MVVNWSQTMWRSGLLGLAAVLALALAACGPGASAEKGSAGGAGGGGGGQGGARGERLLLATTAQLADALRNITAELPAGAVRVESLLGEGVDPHTYKLTRTDMARLAGADSVFFSGLHLEGKMTEVLERLGQDAGGAGGGKLVVEVGLKLPADRILRPDGAAGEADPHYWMDPELFALASTAMAEALAGRMPEHASGVRQGAERYRAEIQRLADYAKAAFGKVPEAKRTLITSHDAFGYLGRAFGLRVLAVQGISTESEAGVRDIERLVDQVVSEKVTAVFVETSVPDRTLRAVVAGAASRGHTVSIGGTLFSDAMGAPGTYTGTWIGMMDHNITTIARALGADVPAAGMAGKLAGTLGDGAKGGGQ